MKKLLILFLCACSLSVFAQDDDENQGGMVIRMDTVKVTDSKLVAAAASRPAAQQLIDYICDQTRQCVMDAAGASKHFDITDMETAEKYDQELRSERAMSLTEEELEQLRRKMATKMLASDWVMEVDITQCQLTAKVGGQAFTAILHITITLKDRRDPNMRVIDSQRFVTDVSKLAPKISRETAITQSLEAMKEDFTNHFTHSISVYGKGLGFFDDHLKISCGANYGVKKGDKFEIFHVTYDPAEKKVVETPLGRGQVISVADHHSLLRLLFTIGVKTKTNIMESTKQRGWIRVKSVIKE